MCDTILALPSATAVGSTLFGKNSDRQRNEAQLVERHVAAEHEPGAHVRCTYIDISQARRTYAVLLSRPFWTWGAEMGANEHGVVIGNEGLQARSPSPQEPALLGMDLLRLGLERGGSAAEAVEVITALLKEYGQGGNCGHIRPDYYNNGFLVADAVEGFIVETVGRDWIVKRAVDTCAISNCYSITGDTLRSSAGMTTLLRDLACGGDEPLDPAALLTDLTRVHIGQGQDRRDLARSRLTDRAPRIRSTDMFAILRDHGPEEESGTWNPRESSRYGLCIHAGTRERGGQTTSSMVSELGPRAVHWVTGSSAPCMSIFKPLFLDVEIPKHGPPPTGSYDSQTFWWCHEAMHRQALSGDFVGWLSTLIEERDQLEADFAASVEKVAHDGTDGDRAQLVAACWAKAAQLEANWMRRLPAPKYGEDAWSAGWREMNRFAGLDRE